MNFPTKYSEILSRIEKIDPIKYGNTRNYLNGAITYLSPYISRGVISTKMVLDSVLAKGYPIEEIESLVKELSWRDYFQRLGQVRNLDNDIKFPQSDVERLEIPLAVVNAESGIHAIDQAIEDFYANGYMHNHMRMYTAALVTNIGKSHWLLPSKWMYYHLLDGDWASNRCSWQWVCGANSNKKYIANQENINRFSATQQQGTFLDLPYESLPPKMIPKVLQETSQLVISNFTENFDENFTITRIYTDSNGDPFSESGTWAFDNAKMQINLSGVGSIELTNQTSTVSSSDYNILRLKKHELWYYYENGGSRHEFHLIK